MAKKTTRKKNRPPLHAVLYSLPGGKKSTMLATFPKPMHIDQFDPIGKDQPYYREMRGGDVEEGETDLGIPFRRLYDSDGKLGIEIFYFHDLDPEKPDATPLFRKHIRAFDYTQWETWGIDSLTAAERSYRYHQQFKVQPDARNPMKWYAGATDGLEQLLCVRVSGWPINVVVLAHISEEDVTAVDSKTGRTQKIIKRVEGELTEDGNRIRLRGIAAPGRLAKKYGLTSSFAEVYHLYSKRGEKGIEYYVQTEGDEDWVALSQIRAPDGCLPHYDELWANFDKD